MTPLSVFIEERSQRLVRDKWKISPNPIATTDAKFDLVATKLHFTWKGLVLISQHLIVRYVQDPDTAAMCSLFEDGVRYVKSINRVPLFAGMQFGYMIIPCIVTEKIEQITSGPTPPPIPNFAGDSLPANPHALLAFVNGAPRNHFAVTELPVVYELESQFAHFYRSTPLWGAWMYPIARNIITKYVE